MHVDCKQSPLDIDKVLRGETAVRAERCQRLSLCLVSGCEESNGLMSFAFIPCQGTANAGRTVCANSTVRWSHRPWPVTFGFWVIVCQVLKMVMMKMWRVCYSQGTFCTFDCLLITPFVKETRTRHVASVRPPPAHRHRIHNWMHMNEEKKEDCTHWEHLYSSTEQIYTK